MYHEIEKLPFKLCHVSHYLATHEYMQNGLVIYAVIDSMYCESWNEYHTIKLRDGIYEPGARFKITAKEYPKFRKALYKKLVTYENYKTSVHGINGGTAISKTKIYDRYELSGFEVV